jgi:hypothetical protein
MQLSGLKFSQSNNPHRRHLHHLPGGALYDKADAGKIDAASLSGILAEEKIAISKIESATNHREGPYIGKPNGKVK